MPEAADLVVWTSRDIQADRGRARGDFLCATFTITADTGVGTPATVQVTVTVTDAPVVDPPATGSLGSLNSIVGS
ncbi:hypothetical protein [Rhodococcus sp. ARC_M6]|uniref:hypothetical protein n=1 Tax=Rhodococcus sp. ARC_M6 TaxID=2928852 RepID=UPI001FB40D40|nr:hypothetical protein [Rhodococcus sp. ARC_M6]MCJ0905197.1 hypothetical protein [Rhodococcus sp. ARC_M6]